MAVAAFVLAIGKAQAYDNGAVAQYVGEFIRAGTKPPAIEAAYYAPMGVDYFDQGILSRDQILNDIADYDARWPVRSFEIASDLDIRWGDHFAVVNFTLAYELHNGTKHRSGVIPEAICVTTAGQIIAIANHRF